MDAILKQLEIRVVELEQRLDAEIKARKIGESFAGESILYVFMIFCIIFEFQGEAEALEGQAKEIEAERIRLYPEAKTKFRAANFIKGFRGEAKGAD